MGADTAIEWTESTWNPVTGCTKVSLGCTNCYAERMAVRLQAMGQPNYAKGFGVSLHRHVLGLPLTWRRPRRVFVNSMSDLFHEDVPIAFIRQVFDIMRRGDWHQYQILTKRSARLVEIDPLLRWPPHVWMGVTVESAEYVSRIDDLRACRAAIRFLSLEPLLGPMPDIDLTGIDWVIVGGESGRSARPMNETWALDIRDQCVAAGVPFFFKQWGGANKKKAGRVLQGRTWDEMPTGAVMIGEDRHK